MLHMVLNLVALGLFGAGAGLRFAELDAERTAAIPLILSIIALAALSYSGYLGGHLVYGDGIGVGRHRRETRIPEATIVARPNEEGGAVAVADNTAVGEGETLRVELDGVIVAIARVEGVLYAFQDFCTHRYGPLSEGALQGCDVVCPWHKSRFDVRTGKVTQGPAKIDLRTFRVVNRDGKIWLEVPRTP
jgi:nitrite reductase/ring-hydroxylating ferredoxin subunit